jgi:hypothetical protein
MGVEPTYIAAWLLPVLIGGGIWAALRGPLREPGDIAATIGAGWLIGVFAAAACARAVASADTARTFALTWPWCVGIGAIAWGVAFLRSRGTSLRPLLAIRASSGAGRWLWWLALLLIVTRMLLIGDEASLRPVFPWDAWSAWSTKPKAWFLSGHAEPYVSMIEWLANPQLAVRTAAAWNYPELLAWVQLWFASAAGGWNEPLVDVAWCGALVAFALAAYGYWRALGLAPWLVMLLVYGLISLPLVDAHVALAGYADLWVAITLGFAVLAWTRWLAFRDPAQLALAVAVALALPAIKLEGTVWLAVFLAAVAFDLVPRWRWRFALVLGAIAVAGVLAVTSRSIHVGWNRIEIPSLGTFELAWHGVGGAMLESLFTLPNWHLLWYAVPVLLVLRRARLRTDRAARLLGLTLLIDFAFLFVLFFFTTASAWAQDFTSANRLILQLVPSVFVLAAVLLRPISAIETSRADRDKQPASPAPTVPA